MRIAFYEPPGARADPSLFDSGRLGDLVEAALIAAGHEISRIPVRSADESLASETNESRAGDGAEASWLAGYFRSGRRPPPEIWISSLVSDRAVDHIGPAASAALGIPYVLVQPSMPAAGPAPADAGADSLSRMVADADAVIVFSRAHAEWIRSALPEYGDRLFVLPPFIDLNPIAAVVRSRAALRAALSSNHRLRLDVPWLIAAGPMSTDRHLESFRVISRAATLASNLDWQLIVAGSGPRRDDIGALFRGSPRRLDRHLAIAAPEDLTAILAAGDLFLWPFDDDESSLTVLEAQAVGLGVIGASSSGLQDVVANGHTGMLTKPDNHASFANAITFLLRQSDFRRTFAQKAPQWISSYFDIHVVAPQLSAALGRIRDKSPSRRG